MSNAICVCNNGIGNTGLPLCVQLQKVIKKVIFVQTVSNGGVITKIDPATTLNKLWVTALLNNSDKSIAWFPTPEIKNIDTPKSDPVFQKFEDDSSNFVREGVRQFAGLIPSCPPMYKAKLETVRCNANTGVYLVDIEGNLIGMKVGTDGFLYPLPINAQSIVAKVVLGNDKNVTSVMLDFEFPAFMNDADIRMIAGSAFPDFSPLTIAGLLDVNAKLVSVTDTVLTIDLSTPSPDLSAPITIQGWVTADFLSSNTSTLGKIYDVTDTVDKTITAAEISAGRYTLTYSTLITKTLILAAKKNGYDATQFTSIAIVTP